MKIHAHFQQKNGGDPTVEWGLARVGVFTASEFDSLITPLGKIRTGEGVESYLCKKLAERWIGGALPSAFSGNFVTEQGNILEEWAIPFAEFEYGLKIRQVGFVSTDCGRSGCSPDGLVGFDDAKLSKTGPTDYKLAGDESGIEIKCPNLDTHIKYLLGNEIPKDYIAQVQGSMLITGCSTWHFLSYRRNLPALHLVINRDEAFCEALAQALDEFTQRFDIAMEKLVKINGGPPNPRHRGIVPFKPDEQKPVSFDLIP